MEGHAQVLDQAFTLAVHQELPDAVLVKIARVIPAHVVEQVIVKVAYPGALERGPEHGLRLLSVPRAGPGRQLGGKHIALARVSLDERLAGGRLGALIAIGCIKVREPTLQEQIHHLRHLIQIDLSPKAGQAHQAKAQLGDFFTQIRHVVSPLQKHGSTLVDQPPAAAGCRGRVGWVPCPTGALERPSPGGVSEASGLPARGPSSCVPISEGPHAGGQPTANCSTWPGKGEAASRHGKVPSQGIGLRPLPPRSKRLAASGPPVTHPVPSDQERCPSLFPTQTQAGGRIGVSVTGTRMDLI